MSLRILYVGTDLALYRFLQDSLEMKIIRCVGQSNSLLLIRGIQYSAILLDEVERDLERSIRKIKLHKNTPIVFNYGPPENIVENIKTELSPLL